MKMKVLPLDMMGSQERGPSWGTHLRRTNWATAAEGPTFWTVLGVLVHLQAPILQGILCPTLTWNPRGPLLPHRNRYEAPSQVPCNSLSDLVVSMNHGYPI